MNKKQLINFLGAGTITGFILAIVMLLSGGGAAAGAAVEATTGTAVPVIVPNTPGITEVVPLANYNQLQVENDQLLQDLQTMQGREAQYQAQIKSANQLMAQAQNTVAANGQYQEHEEHEEHDEHEEHEHEFDD